MSDLALFRDSWKLLSGQYRWFQLRLVGVRREPQGPLRLAHGILFPGQGEPGDAEDAIYDEVEFHSARLGLMEVERFLEDPTKTDAIPVFHLFSAVQFEAPLSHQNFPKYA